MADGSQKSHQLQEKYGLENGKSYEVPTDYDEAVALAGNGRFHFLLLLVCGLCFVSVTIETASTAFLLPSAQCDLKFSIEEKGLLNSMGIIGMISSSHLWGFLADTRGRRKILIMSLLLDSITTIVSAFAHAFWLYLALRFLNGFFILAGVSVIYTYLGEFHGPQTRSKSIVWVCVFSGIGSTIQPGIAWLVIPQPWSFELPWCTFNSWRMFVLLCAVPGLVTAILLFLFFPESPKFLMAIDKKEEALQVLRKVYAWNTGNSPERFPVKSLVLVEDNVSNPSKHSDTSILGIMLHMWEQTAPLFIPPYLLKTLLVCLIQFGLYASATGLWLWMPDIFNRLASYSALHSGSSDGICLAYSTPLNHQADQRVNDEVLFSCDFNNVILEINNRTMPFNPNPDIIQCHNGSLWLSENSDVLISKVLNGSLVLDMYNPTEVETCNADVDFTVFQNTLILGVANAFSLFVGGYLVAYFNKKVVLVTSLSISGIAGITLNYVSTMWEVMVSAGIYVIFSGMCISVLVTSVVDIFPTHLRAMAVCLSLMIGRLGSVSINLLLGIMLEMNCTLMMFFMGAISISCGLLCLLLPAPPKTLSKM